MAAGVVDAIGLRAGSHEAPVPVAPVARVARYVRICRFCVHMSAPVAVGTFDVKGGARDVVYDCDC